MTRKIRVLALLFTFVAGMTGLVAAQSTSGAISGTVIDERQAVIPTASVTARNIRTNESRTTGVDREGRYRFANLPVGEYEVIVQAKGFGKLARSGVELLLNQEAVINLVLKPSAVEELVTVTENASLLNTLNAEVSTRFDSKRLSELPLAPNRNILNAALSAAGVSQLGSGQTGFAQGMNFSVNGMRLRSNNFMFDGQDSNDPSVSGSQQPINNPDVVQELRLVTNQFAAEYGRAAGSVVNVITKSGTNAFHGSGFWFNNNDIMNARSNLDKAAGFTDAPRRNENQYGGTVGGPILKDKTFFFASYQRWTDRELGAGATINGVPTEAGRQLLQAVANRPQVAALLKFLPAAQSANNTFARFSPVVAANCNPTGWGAAGPDLCLGTARIVDERKLNFLRRSSMEWPRRSPVRRETPDQRSILSSTIRAASAVARPLLPGSRMLFPRAINRPISASPVFCPAPWSTNCALPTSALGPRLTLRIASSQEIPSIEVNQLGLIGFNAATSRTAIGLAVNLPQYRYNNTYQILDNLSYTRGSHAMKFGFDIRRVQVKSFFFPTIRGRLAYQDLESFVDDIAIASAINKPVTGGSEIQYYNWYDYFFYAQDEWRVSPASRSVTVCVTSFLVIRSARSQEINQQILAANNNNPALKFPKSGSRHEQFSAAYRF